MLRGPLVAHTTRNCLLVVVVVVGGGIVTGDLGRIDRSDGPISLSGPLSKARETPQVVPSLNHVLPLDRMRYFGLLARRFRLTIARGVVHARPSERACLSRFHVHADLGKNGLTAAVPAQVIQIDEKRSVALWPATAARTQPTIRSAGLAHLRRIRSDLVLATVRVIELCGLFDSLAEHGRELGLARIE